MMEEKKETFTYTYSASRQDEVRRIREKYAPATKEEDKLERLRRLDRAGNSRSHRCGHDQHADHGRWYVLYDGVERHDVYPRHHHRRCRDRWYLRRISAVSVCNEKAAG